MTDARFWLVPGMGFEISLHMFLLTWVYLESQTSDPGGNNGSRKHFHYYPGFFVLRFMACYIYPPEYQLCCIKTIFAYRMYDASRYQTLT